MALLISLVTSFILYIVLDLLWLGVIAKSFITKWLAPWMTSGLKIIPALMVYVLLAAGLTFFVLPRSGTWYMALVWGAVMGLVVYGVYDLTNLSTILGWPIKFVLVDMSWGIVSGAIVAAVTYFISGLVR